MAIGGIGSAGSAPAFLPLRRSGGGDFSQSLRAQLRAEIGRAMSPAPEVKPETAATEAKSSALQQSLLARGAAAFAAPAGVPASTGGPRTVNTASATNAADLTRWAADGGDWPNLARTIGGQYLPPDVADVFVRQMALESDSFSPDVISGRRVSSAGAEGIAQLMPSSYPHVNRLDPVASLNAAAATMRDNLQTYGGDVRKALAAYNAGGGRVAADVARLGGAWESGLPTETQLYLRHLMGNAHA